MFEILEKIAETDVAGLDPLARKAGIRFVHYMHEKCRQYGWYSKKTIAEDGYVVLSGELARALDLRPVKPLDNRRWKFCEKHKLKLPLDPVMILIDWNGGDEGGDDDVLDPDPDPTEHEDIPNPTLEPALI